MSKTKSFSIFLIIVIFVSLNYSIDISIFFSFIATLGIFFVGYFTWKQKLLEVFYLKVKFKTLLLAWFISLLVSMIVFFITKFLNSGLVFIKLDTSGLYFHDIFYTLNEEIIFCALLFGSMVKYIKKIKPIYVSIFSAALFSFLHFIFYNFFLNMPEIIYFNTFISLFLFGLIRNNLLLIFGNILYPWAIHLGFSYIIFASNFIDSKNYHIMTEVERVNYTLGSPLVVFILIVLSLLTIYLSKNSKTITQI